jgi:hypothetical protein
VLRKSLFTALTLGIAMLLVPIQAAAESGFAKVRANGSLATVGGPDTNTATSSRLAAGVYSVQFFGSYPSQTTADKVAVTTTAESAIYGVSNATVTQCRLRTDHGPRIHLGEQQHFNYGRQYVFRCRLYHTRSHSCARRGEAVICFAHTSRFRSRAGLSCW